MNRAVFSFNDKMYIWFMEPIARYYSYVLPRDLRDSIENFFRNLEEPVRLINTLLQGRFADAGTVLVRFTINSTLGVYGLGDAASRVFDYHPVEASLGETFAVWGIGDGFYLVVPFYGSSTLRDFTGTVVDGFGITPYYIWTDDIYVMGGVYAGKTTNSISRRLGEYEELKEVLFDPYIAFRNAYFQHRLKVRDHSPDQAGQHPDTFYPVSE
jgi:phospholipid-binding lipoprotein MlaA